MDEQRRQNVAYQYLCRLEEAKRWMEACLKEELPSPVELEESLRNGVLLAKLGHCFAPAVVPLKKIYDAEQLRYQATGLHFRHTDNINFWLSAIAHVGLPSTFFPETTDIYDKKNMPRVVYCIHALSLFLFRLGLAPQIHDLYGKVKFSAEELSNMASELAKYGLQLPAFSKIGGILANELSVDEAAVHAAVLAINEAVERGVVKDTLAALQNPSALLVNLQEPLAPIYQELLAQAKAEKEQEKMGLVSQVSLFVQDGGESWDLYDCFLTQAEIQGNINHVNVFQAVCRINRAIQKGVAADTVKELMCPEAQLPPVYPSASAVYQQELTAFLLQELGHEELFVAMEMLSAVVLINRALEAGDGDSCWSSLVNPTTGLAEVERENAHRYFDALVELRHERMPDGVTLSWNDLQATVYQVNAQVQEETNQILAVSLINEALDQGSPKKTLSALLLPSAGLDNVSLAVAPRYHLLLVAAKRQKAQVRAGVSGLVAGAGRASPVGRAVPRIGPERGLPVAEAPAGWGAGCTPVGEGESSLQQRPHPLECHKFSLSLPQSAITKVTAAHDRQQLWKANVGFIIQFQARLRGFLVREKFAEQSHFLRTWLPAVIKIQVASSGLQSCQGLGLSELQGFLPSCFVLSRVRMIFWPLNSRGYEHAIGGNRQEAGEEASEDAAILTLLPVLPVHSPHPTVSVVCRFAHLLNQSQEDFMVEAELLKLQEEVVRKIRSNQQLQQDLDLMDIKIGLLVKNRITLQEVVSHCKKLTKKNKEQLSGMMVLDKQKGLKSLSKEKRQKLEAYQHLFYLLQTQPIYLAKLTFHMPQNKTTKFMESVIFSLYNYASNRREAYLLLQLFKTMLQEEIRSKVEQPQDMVTGNPTVVRLVVRFYRNGRGQSALREILGRVIQEVLEDKRLSVHTDPIHLYKSWINQSEAQTGQRSHLPYDVTPEQALSHPEVQRRLDISLHSLLAVTDKFLVAIMSSVDRIPYGMRYVAKVLRTTLAEKFPDNSENEVYKVVGNLLYYRFLNPAIVAPDAFDIVAMAAGGALATPQRHTLGAVAQVLQHAAAGKVFSGESRHLRALNDYLEETHLKFRSWFVCRACQVPEPEERFAMDEYSDMVAVAKPVVYITFGELVNTHRLLLEHQDWIAPDHCDPLHELLEDLGELPTVPDLIAPGQPHVQTLPHSSAPNSTKQMLADIMQFQPRDSLEEMLSLPLSREQEAAHQRLMCQRQACETQIPEPLRRHRSLIAHSLLPLADKRRRVLRNLRQLEGLGLVSARNGYQGLVDGLAKDICSQHRHRQWRKAELGKLQATLQGLDAKMAFYEEQGDYYSQYIRTCLGHLAPRAKTSGKGKKQPSLHYTAAQLQEKGVLVEIEDLPHSQYVFRNVIFDITPGDEAGKFEVNARFLGVDMERFQLHYQDLLQLQYEGVAVMKLFNKAKVNVNLLIFLLNKKLLRQ
uniref:IQ motif containing GTPase activating protein 3 n=1 Tax=Canis lupus familiaris TaxID=9615 RepID=A0A8P0TKD8_CANLF